MISSASTARAQYRKAERLLRGYQFRRVYQKGRRYNSTLFTLFALKTTEQCNRLGITATRKTGNAVERNRCKRILREIFRHQKHLIASSFDLVFNVKSTMLTASYQEAEAEFLRLVAIITKR